MCGRLNVGLPDVGYDESLVNGVVVEVLPNELHVRVEDGVAVLAVPHFRYSNAGHIDHRLKFEGVAGLNAMVDDARTGNTGPRQQDTTAL